jgi:hypothetical protein
VAGLKRYTLRIGSDLGPIPRSTVVDGIEIGGKQKLTSVTVGQLSSDAVYK